MEQARYNNIKRGPLANCIALHDLKNSKPDLRHWVKYVVQFFEKYNIVPTKAGVSGSNIKENKKNILFQNAIKKLELCNYEDVSSIWMGALPPDCGIEMFDTIFMAQISMRDHRNKVVLCFDDNIAPFDYDLLNILIRDLAKFFDAKYGYCYQRLFKEGAIFYPSGIISGLERGHPEVELIGRWLRHYVSSSGRYKTGDLRDIYPVNVLSAAHFEIEVKGKRLKDWIEMDKRHGNLMQLDEDLWAWHVQKENIMLVRESLRPTGRVICI